MSPLGRNYCRWQPSDAFPFRKRTCLPINTINQLPYFFAPATQRHAATHMQRIPCTSHPEPRSNATRMLQSPATKCHTGAAPATQRHTATYMQRTIPCTSHPEPLSNAPRMLQSTAPATKCHTGAAPATQRHNSTYHSLHQPHRSTLQLEVSRVQASQFHVYKRANFTCTSEPAPL